MRNEKEIDFLFLISRPPIMDAGYVVKHAMYLAEGVNSKGYSSALLILPQSEIRMALIRRKRKVMSLGLFLLSFIYSTLFFSRVSTHFFLMINKKMNRSAFEFNPHSGIRIFYGNTSCLSFSKRVICNDWITASYLQDKIDMRKGYFIVYHSHENDIKELSDVVVSTYHKWHNIIVTNETIRKKFDLDKRTTIIPAIDANKISDENNDIRKDNFVLIPLRKNPIKGAEYAIEAIDLLLRERSDITICTFGDYNLSHSANSKWKHLGIVTDEVLVSLFREAEILVSPSIEDGVPGIAAEAMANGCAVISTDVSGARDLIEDGYNGMIIPIKDSKAIVNNITFLLMHRDVLIKFQNNAKTISRKFSKEMMVDSFLNAVDYYEKVKTK